MPDSNKYKVDVCGGGSCLCPCCMHEKRPVHMALYTCSGRINRPLDDPALRESDSSIVQVLCYINATLLREELAGPFGGQEYNDWI
jgi:hypothetical protein